MGTSFLSPVPPNREFIESHSTKASITAAISLDSIHTSGLSSIIIILSVSSVYMGVRMIPDAAVIIGNWGQESVRM